MCGGSEVKIFIYFVGGARLRGVSYTQIIFFCEVKSISQSDGNTYQSYGSEFYIDYIFLGD